jgi:exonuclease VII small subunit
MQRIISLDPARYQRHLIHGENRDWAETNCYVDVWIELLHALGFEPIAALPFTLGIDFEGDQWTFFKFPLADIYELYGLDVQELAIWRSLVEHVEEQVGRGRPVLVELDSYFLPDTAGTAYQLEHVKSTVAVTEIDAANHHMGYFHGQGYYHLDGQDFISIFRLSGQPDPAMLPPYVEFVKAHRQEKLEDSALLEASLQLLRKHLRLLPEKNPFQIFKMSFQQDLDWLMGEDLKTFHLYSFATLRQYGACFELSATYVKWLAERGQRNLEEAISAFSEISNGAKTFQFQLARAMNRKKPLDMSPLDDMAQRWERGMQLLASRYC